MIGYGKQAVRPVQPRHGRERRAGNNRVMVAVAGHGEKLGDFSMGLQVTVVIHSFIYVNEYFLRSFLFV
jgi:hypothetical protein